ncbi:MAG: 30S ribosome-binding factor RbfA [Ginsengibacter sp.]
MTEGKRQKQVAAVINQELNNIFLRMGLNMSNGGMISISSVKITPDLFEARVYLSFFQVDNKEAALAKIKDRYKEIRKELGTRVRHQLRSVPQLSFYIDDTLDYVFKMEELLRKVRTDEAGRQ